MTIRLFVTVILTLTAGITVVIAEQEEEVSLDKVPKKVLVAAQKAIPGIKLTNAEVEKTRKGLVYEIEGILDGKEYEIEVSAEGKVLEVEQEGEDDEDKDGDKNDDNENDDGEEEA